MQPSWRHRTPHSGSVNRCSGVVIGLLLLPILLQACSIGTRARVLVGSKMRVQVQVSDNANRRSPVALDLVLVYDKKLLKELSSLSASDWFDKRRQFRRDYLDSTGFDAWGWEWVPGQNVPLQEYTTIGRSGQNQRLGLGSVVGTRIWDQQSMFDLHLGPLTLEQFQDFLPSGKRFQPLCDLTRFYLSDAFDFEVCLALQASDVPESRLSASNGPRLGWTSWLHTKDSTTQTSQIRLRPARMYESVAADRPRNPNLPTAAGGFR